MSKLLHCGKKLSSKIKQCHLANAFFLDQLYKKRTLFVILSSPVFWLLYNQFLALKTKACARKREETHLRFPLFRSTMIYQLNQGNECNLIENKKIGLFKLFKL